jgi:DNA-binding XRE family transcriptional regulator
LEGLTCRADLHLLTLLPLKGSISSYQLIDSTSRFCPACYADDERASRPKYDRLLWTIRCVSACPKHELRLVKESKSKGLRSLPYTAPGASRSDGSSLAKYKSERATAFEIETAKLISNLLDDVSSVGSATVSHTPEFLTQAATLLFAGNHAALARHLGLSKSQVHGWMHEGIVPSMSAAVRIACAFGCPIVDVLQGKGSTLRPRDGHRESQGLFGLKRGSGHRTPRQALLSSLSNFMKLHPLACAHDAARHLDISPTFIRKNFPAENAALQSIELRSIGRGRISALSSPCLFGELEASW